VKKIYLGLLVAGFLCLLVFYVYGDDMYAWGKPRVQRVALTQFIGYSDVALPHQAIYRGIGGDFVYALDYTQGFSRTIITVRRIEVEVVIEDDGQGRVMLAGNNDIAHITWFAVLDNGGIEDGARVVVY